MAHSIFHGAGMPAKKKKPSAESRNKAAAARNRTEHRDSESVRRKRRESLREKGVMGMPHRYNPKKHRYEK